MRSLITISCVLTKLLAFFKTDNKIKKKKKRTFVALGDSSESGSNSFLPRFMVKNIVEYDCFYPTLGNLAVYHFAIVRWSPRQVTVRVG